MTFTVAIIGRPNVGKSTLFNRLTGTPHALVLDVPGVTRDRREGQGRIGPLEFSIFDTAGLEEAEAGTLSARMTEQTLKALTRADVALMLVDGRAGITPMDRHFAQVVRKSGKPVVLAVNKAEGRGVNDTLMEAFSLGLGEGIAISAAHGEGLADLYNALAPFEREVEEQAPEEEGDKPLTLAIVGRPNAGKSTLINTYLGEDRLLTGPEAGITRDSIAVPFTYHGTRMKLVDTAGMRKRGKVAEALEKMSVGDSLHAIQYADVVVVLMEAEQAFEKQDLQIADHASREGRAVVLAVSKWDKVPVKDREAYMKIAEERVEETLPQLRGIPIIPISAQKGVGLKQLLEAAFKMNVVWNTRISTGKLNNWLEEALARHAPPLIDGRRLKIRYMTQAKTRPPTFALSSNLEEIPDHYSRYLVNGLRESFGLRGVPIRIKVKKSKNPYAVD